MKKTFILALLVLLVTFSGCTINSTPVDDNLNTEQLAKSFLTDFVNKDFNKMVQNYRLSDTVKSKLTVALLKQIHAQLISTYGEFKEIIEIKSEQVNNLQVINQVSKFGSKKLNIIISFDGSKVINGFYYTNADNPTGDGLIEIGEQYKLKGKLTIPSGDGPFPVLIIMHGSGPTDMNCTVGENAPYRDIANGLQKQGIAVLRFNKRTFTYGKEIANNKNATVYDEYIYDSQEAVKFLQKQDKIDAENIFIVAHSQSGYLLPRIAENNPDVKAFIALAAAEQRAEDAIVIQTKYLINLDGIVTEQEEQILAQRIQAQKIIKDIKNQPADINVLGAFRSYWLDLADYEPTKEIKNITRPVMFLQGERDYQVDMNSFKAWQEAVKGLSNFSFKSYPKLNHLFMAGEGPANPQEYYLKGTVDSAVINDIAEFIKK